MRDIMILRGRLPERQDHMIMDIDPVTSGHGYRIKRFLIAGEQGNQNDDCYGKLSTGPTGTLDWNWDNNQECAWASVNNASNTGTNAPFELVDAGTIIVSALYLHAGSNTASDDINYYVELQRVKLSDDETIMALVKERAQGDL